MVELTVVIPTYNRSARLQACLAALARQNQPAADFEVVVVVDGSTDATRDMLGGLETPYRLRAVYQENRGQHLARNHGARIAEGRYYLFLDDDIVAGERLVEEHLRLHRTHRRVAGLGQIALGIPPDADWFVRCYAEGWARHFDSLNRGERLPSWQDCYSGNVSVARDDFWEVGGFAPDLRRNEDVELGFRLERAGVSLTYLAEAVGCQHERKGLAALTSDFERAGAGWPALWQRHPPMLPHLVGDFEAGSRKKVRLRRLLLTLRVSPRALGWIGRAIQHPARRRKWYSFLRNYSYWRGVRESVGREQWRRLTRGTRILMYHAIGGPDERPTRYIVPQRRFLLQMALLRWLRYGVLSLDEFLDCRRHFRLPPARSVVITVDDGYLDSRVRALPVLQRFGFPMTVFLVSDAIGTTNAWDKDGELTGRPLLSWSDIEQMRREGVQFGSHTRTHPVLTELSESSAWEEIQGSRDELERRLDTPIRALAYPFGEHSAEVRRIAEQAGFLGSCGVDPGQNTLTTPIHDLRRIEIFGTDSLRDFAVKLWRAGRRAGGKRRPTRSEAA